MGANVDIEESAAVHSLNADNEKNEGKDAQITGAQPSEKPDVVYDTGLVPWLQVFGSFFLFFNSWYVVTHAVEISLFNHSDQMTLGVSLTLGVLSRHTMSRIYCQTCPHRPSLGSGRCSHSCSCFSES